MQLLRKSSQGLILHVLQERRIVLEVIEGSGFKNEVRVLMEAAPYKLTRIIGKEVAQSSVDWHLQHQIHKGLTILEEIGLGDGLQDRLRAEHRMRTLLIGDRQTQHE